MLIFLGKVYLGQRDTSNLEINAEHKAIAITPNVLREATSVIQVNDARGAHA